MSITIPTTTAWPIVLPDASETTDGIMSAGDKAKIARIGHVYDNSSRPSANTFPAGTEIFNSDDDAPNYSDGNAWRDAFGNLI